MKARQAKKVAKKAALGQAAYGCDTALRAVRRMYRHFGVHGQGARQTCLFPVYRMLCGEWSLGKPTPNCPKGI